MLVDQIGSMKTKLINVPHGSQPGQTVNVEMDDGRNFQVVIPSGKNNTYDIVYYILYFTDHITFQSNLSFIS